jgi:hypothetical protein
MLLGVCEGYLGCQRAGIHLWPCFTTVEEILSVSVELRARSEMQFIQINTRNPNALVESASAGLSSA